MSEINRANKEELENLSSSQLFSLLEKDCDILRGPINQDEFKNYVIPIVFFKRVSDVYDEEILQALEEFDGDIESAAFPENHRFQIPKGCHWNDIRETSSDIGTAISKAMNEIERANPETLEGIFSGFDEANWTDKNKLSDEVLKNLVEHMSSFKLGNDDYDADIMGDAYEFLLKKFADLSKKNGGEFFTPRTIVALMVELLDPQPGDTVYDPACGTGGMLLEATKHIKDKRLTYGKIYGQENNLSTSAIARMNLFLHGAADFKIIKGDTLRFPGFTQDNRLKTFDCVIANPPFSLKKWGAQQFSKDPYGRNIWGSPTDSNADMAWLQHMVCSMDPDKGKCAVVLPQGVLFRSSKDKQIRKQLVESDKLEAIITLPGGVFYGAGVSACILLLNNNKQESHKNRVCMIDASEIYTPQRAQIYMSKENTDEVYKYFSDYADVVEKVKVVSLDEIKNNDYDLSVSRFIEQKPVETEDPAEVKARYFAAYQEMLKAEDRMKKLLLEGGFLNE